jgi:integrase
LEGHRKCLREASGNTLSDEFADVTMGKLIEALRPNAFDQLEESTRNAGIHRREGRGALQEPGSSRAAGLDGVRLHDLRHTHASLAAERGVSLRDAVTAVNDELGAAVVGRAAEGD